MPRHAARLGIALIGEPAAIVDGFSGVSSRDECRHSDTGRVETAIKSRRATRNFLPFASWQAAIDLSETKMRPILAERPAAKLNVIPTR